MAPTIQLAGNFMTRSSSDVATHTAARTVSASGVAGAACIGEPPCWASPDAARINGNAAVRMITRMVCTTAMPATSARRSLASMMICDSAPGLPASRADVRSHLWMCWR